jgi:hypothetical protein
MVFPGVCAIAVDGSDAVKTVNAIAAKVENVANEKRRMLAYLFEQSGAPV